MSTTTLNDFTAINTATTKRIEALNENIFREIMSKTFQIGKGFLGGILSAIRRLVRWIGKFCNCSVSEGEIAEVKEGKAQQEATHVSRAHPGVEGSEPSPDSDALIYGAAAVASAAGVAGVAAKQAGEFEDAANPIQRIPALEMKIDIEGAEEDVERARAMILDALTIINESDADYLKALADPAAAEDVLNRLSDNIGRLHYAHRLATRQMLMASSEVAPAEPGAVLAVAKEAQKATIEGRGKPDSRLMLVASAGKSIMDEIDSQINVAALLIKAHEKEGDSPLRATFERAIDARRDTLMRAEVDLLENVQVKRGLKIDMLDFESSAAEMDCACPKKLFAKQFAAGVSRPKTMSKTVENSTMAKRSVNTEVPKAPNKPVVAAAPARSGFSKGGFGGGLTKEQMLADLAGEVIDVDFESTESEAPRA